jgi:hypothetical protein
MVRTGTLPRYGDCAFDSPGTQYSATETLRHYVPEPWLELVTAYLAPLYHSPIPNDDETPDHEPAAFANRACSTTRSG